MDFNRGNFSTKMSRQAVRVRQAEELTEKEREMEKQPEEPREDSDHHRQEQEQEQEQHQQQKPQAPNISPMKPVTEGAYGGGMYGTEVGQPKQPVKPPASDTQSADGPVGPNIEPKHKPPPSSGDRDIDITGQSYIQ